MAKKMMWAQTGLILDACGRALKKIQDESKAGKAADIPRKDLVAWRAYVARLNAEIATCEAHIAGYANESKVKQYKNIFIPKLTKTRNDFRFFVDSAKVLSREFDGALNDLDQTLTLAGK